MDEVEFLRKGPGVFAVCYQELAIGGKDGGLHRRKVCAEYVCGGVFACHFYGPEAGAGCDVEDVLEGRCDGGEEEAVI